MAVTEEVKSKRDSIAERLKKKYPDREYADDEALYGQISDDFDQYDKDIADRDRQISEFQDRETKLGEVMRDPRGASLMMGMRDGEDPAIGLMRRFGPDIRDILDDPDRQEELAKAQADYLDRITKEKDLQTLYEKNLAESLAMLEQFQQETGKSDDEIDALMEKIVAVANDMVVGKFTRETVELFDKANNFDSAIETATAEGEVRGRNAQIKERLRKPSKGDGTPQLDGQNNTAPKREAQPNLGAIDRGGAANIWERGKEKRIKR